MTQHHDPLIEKWRRFRMRPREDRNLILFSALILPVTEIGLRLFGFRRWKGLIEKIFLPASSSQCMLEDLRRETARRVVRSLCSAELHGPTTPNCLERSMTLWWLLRRAGVEGQLQIGCRKNGAKFEAHAWVELDGEALNDGPEVHQHYARFDAPIAAEPSTANHANPRPGGEADF
jgi:hypothetical protein